ncbi:MAG TPA: sialate O-acetylesterase [Gemmataceae bacterium]|jgi:sialate O-acetylesterase|nr:sialate O-acetylesterase [Gemmataceae bacterium]
MKRRTFLALAVAFALAVPAWADVKPHGLFTDNCVLQAGKEVPIWGTAAPGEKITITVKGQQWLNAAVADKDGHWITRLPKMAASNEPVTLTIKGNNEVVVKNVLIGEVWICSGQSNMEWPLRASYMAEEHIGASGDPLLRLLTVPHSVQMSPQYNIGGRWSECSPQTVGNFSAVAYFFGRDLRKALNVPVGLIHTSWGGTPAQAWTSKEALGAEAALVHYPADLEKAIKNYDSDKAKEAYQEAVAKWKEAAAKAKTEGKPPPGKPQQSQPPDKSPHAPSGLYNGMIAPLVPYAIAGAIWYQGESNAGQAHEYRTLFPTMIKDWRKHFGQGDFPFLFVQLPPYKPNDPSDITWAELRDAQLQTAKILPKTGMAVITDVGEEKDIHPKKKEPVGSRLALAARAIAYGEQVEYAGPVLEKATFEDGKAILTFTHVGRGLATPGKEELTGFTSCGADRKFHNAKATITGSDTIEVSCSEVTKPVAVRFGWANYPVVNLWNKDGLPASPFRTDDFLGITAPKK